MSKNCGKSAAAPLITLAISMRLVWLLSIEYTQASNAAWLCPLIGFIMYLPVVFAIKLISKDNCSGNERIFIKHKAADVFLSAIIASALIIDASSCIRLLSNTANIMALGEVPLWLLALPVGLLIFFCCKIGLEAGGFSARIWIKIAIPLIVIMILVQFGEYRPSWLMPVFGGGFSAIMGGGLRCAGVISLLSLPWIFCIEDKSHSSPARFAIWGALSASAVLALLAALAPALIHTEQTSTARIEILLSNGRVHLMLQLITVVLWFGALLHLLNMLCCSAVTILSTAVAEAPKCLLPAMIASAATLLAVFAKKLSGAFSACYGSCVYPAVCILLIVGIFTKYFNRKDQPA